MSKRVLVVDDEKLIVKGIRFSLEQDDMQVDCAYDGEEALEMAKMNKYDIILLDIMLPKESGLTVLQKLKDSMVTKDIPVIMVTAKGSEFDKVTGLNMGADDYIAKPFGMMEFIARVRAVLRRGGIKESGNVLEYKSLVIHPEKHEVLVDGTAVTLTLKEFELLKYLIENRDIVVTRNQILGHVWGYDFDGETRTVDVHIRTLRQKLGECGRYIETVRGVGYRIGG